MSWIRFHSAIMQGAKRGLPRATRFIYMELAIHCKGRKGLMILAPGLSDIDAIHDVIGGNRQEIDEAIPKLTAGADPMVTITNEGEDRVLRVNKWQKWNPGDVSLASHLGSKKSGDVSDPSNREQKFTKKREVSFTKSDTCARVDLDLSLSDLNLTHRSDQDLQDPFQASSDPTGRYMSTGDDQPYELPDKFALSDEWRAIAELTPVVDIKSAFDTFCDYAVLKHWAFDRRAWDARWKIWCRDQRVREQTERARRPIQRRVPEAKPAILPVAPPDAVVGPEAEENCRKLQECIKTAFRFPGDPPESR